MNTYANRIKLLAGVAVLALAGCVTSPPIVQQPMTARPLMMPPAAPVNGAIYQAGYNERPLFEDRRARNVGDTLIISINEKTVASKKSSTSADRSGNIDFAVPTVMGLPGKVFQGASVAASSANTFDGKGASASNNDFTGTIAVTVIEVLPNGNLLVSGEKQLAINQGTEFIRFSGVVNPATVNNNTVSSTQVADARVEYRGTGTIDEAQIMGWLARFFFSVLPF